MIAYFADRNLNILGHASTNLPKGLLIYGDSNTDYVSSGTKVFSFSVLFNKDQRPDIERWAEVGNYVFRQDGAKAHLYSILESRLDTENNELQITAEDAGLDLLGNICGDFAATTAKNIEYYITEFAAGSGFVIGINEIPDRTRTLAWEGEATATERILSVCNAFDAEVEYTFTIDGTAVTGQFIDIYKRRGKDVGIELRYGRDIRNIVIEKSAAYVATALKVSGGVPKGKTVPITLKGYSYDDGDIYVDSNGILKSRSALNRWKRKLSTGDGHITKLYSYDTAVQSTLCAHAVTELKELMNEEINYTVDIINLPENIDCGDTVRIVDDAGELYLSARILKLENMRYAKKYKATLGNFKLLSSGISQSVINLSKRVSAIAEAGGVQALVFNTTFTYDNGTYLFQAHVFQGTEEVTNVYPSSYFSWILRTETGETKLGTGYTKEIASTSLGYGGTVVGRFVDQAQEVNIITRSGDNIVTRNGDAIIARVYTYG